MYVDAAEGCNRIDLLFKNDYYNLLDEWVIGDDSLILDELVIGDDSLTRQLDIQIMHIPCDSPTLPPRGCLQYYYGYTQDDGAPTGTIRTFNYANGIHLANQNQNICFRRESGGCSICFYETNLGDFGVSGHSFETLQNMFNFSSSI